MTDVPTQEHERPEPDTRVDPDATTRVLRRADIDQPDTTGVVYQYVLGEGET